MLLSTHFTLEDAVLSSIASRKGIDNTPSSEQIAVMTATAFYMEKVRALLGNKPINVNSWFRSFPLNTAVGSNNLTSQHPKGEAVDFTCATYGTPLEICKILCQYQDLIPFDQLILEHTWVHISFAILTRKPKGEVLSLLTTGHYAQGLTDLQGNKLV